MATTWGGANSEDNLSFVFLGLPPPPPGSESRFKTQTKVIFRIWHPPGPGHALNSVAILATSSMAFLQDLDAYVKEHNGKLDLGEYDSCYPGLERNPSVSFATVGDHEQQPAHLM